MPNKKRSTKESAKAGGVALTTATLAENVGKKLGDAEITPEKVRQVADAFFELVKREIFDNGSFRLQQLGTFERMRVEASERRNPLTGETVVTPEHYKVKFVPVAGLVRRINKPYEGLKPQVIEEAPKTRKAAPRLQQSERRVQAVDETPLGETKVADENFDDDELPPLEVPDFAFDKDAAPSTRASSASAENDAATNDASAAGGGAKTVSQQTIQNAIIEKLIVRRPVVQNKKLPSDDERRGANGGEKEEADEFQKFINRCWFFAGAAVVLTMLVLGALVYVFLQRTPDGEIVVTQTRSVATAQADASALPQTQRVSAENVLPQERSAALQGGRETAPAEFGESDVPFRTMRIAPEGSVYESLAERSYGAGNLWPYIFSANMLRFPDPDRPGPATELSIPPQPDKFIDRRDIELSVIDVYDSYQSLIAQRPRSDAADIRRQHAVTALVCGESLYAGFIDKYAVRLQPNDVTAARAIVAEMAQ